MAQIKLDNVCVDIPVYGMHTRSLKNKILNKLTLGRLRNYDSEVLNVRVLHDLNLELTPGDRLGLIGRNGAGKSSLLRVLGGVYHPTQGTIQTTGNIASLIDLYMGINLDASGRENILIRGAFLGIKRLEILEKIDDIISFSELNDVIDFPVRTYSSGMHLRLAFAISTIVKPDILIMDEWLAVGDSQFIKKAERRLHEIVNTSKILVLASHSRYLIESVCNRVIWLENGFVIRDGSPSVVCEEYFK